VLSVPATSLLFRKTSLLVHLDMKDSFPHMS
jgi:hypothetical protein